MKNDSLLPILLLGAMAGIFAMYVTSAPPAAAVASRPADATTAMAQAPASTISPTPAETPKASALVTPRAPPLKGRVVAENELEVKSKSAGEVLRVHADLGDTVKQGQLLLELDPTDAQRQVTRAQAGLAAAQARLKQTRENLEIAERCIQSQRSRAAACIRSAEARSRRAHSHAERMKATLSKMVTTQDQYDEAEATAVEAAANLDLTQLQLEDVKTQELALQLRRQDVECAETQVALDELNLREAQQRVAEKNVVAPIDGVVTASFVKPGQLVAAATATAETRLFTIVNLMKLYVVANAGACQLRKMKTGQHVTLHSDALPGETFSGTVVRAAQCAKEGAEALKIEVLGDNRALLAPDMPVTVELLKE